MGADFIEKTARTFRRTWDRERVRLATPTLFTRDPELAPRTIAGTLLGDAHVSAGEQVTIDLEGTQLVARRGLVPIAAFPDPPADVLRAMEASFAVATGQVEEVHPISRVVEVSLC